MPRRRVTGQSINFIIGQYRKLAKDPRASVSQKMRILDRLAVIDGLLNIKLAEPPEATRPAEPGPEVTTDDEVQRMVNQAFAALKNKNKPEETDGE